MGLDVYCKVVVGVLLSDHAKSGTETVKETRYRTRTGEKYEVAKTAQVLTLWNGDRYEEGLQSVTLLPPLSAFDKWLDDHALGLFSNNNGWFTSSGDIIGTSVGLWLSMRGGPLTIPMPVMGDSIAYTKEMLAGIGLDVEPRTYISMELNS